MSNLSVIEKWGILNIRGIKEGAGEFFSPEHARKFYDVNFTKLRFRKDYDVNFSCTLDADGASPSLSIQFTDKGIRKLLKTNQKMIDTVIEDYEELLKFDAEYPDNEELWNE